MANIFRKIGRAIDPTSKKSPLGSITRTAISSLPGGAAALGAVDTFNSATRAPTSKAGGTSSTAAPATPAAALAQAAAPGSAWSKLASSPAVIVGAVAAVVVLLVVLFRGK
jgi:hypothetical protein